jgi:hypothetical protein
MYIYTYDRYIDILKMYSLSINTFSWAPVAHAYNPSYSGGRDQEDSGLKAAWAYSL